MKTVICPECNETLEVSETVKELECPYCQHVFENEYYREDAVDEEGPFYGEVCLGELKKLCDAETFDAEAAGVLWGNPISGEDLPAVAVERLGIDAEQEEVYLLWEKEESCFALCTSGMYLLDGDGEESKHDWDKLLQRVIVYHESEEVLTIGGAWLEMPNGEGECLQDLFNTLKARASVAWERALCQSMGVARYSVEILTRMIESVEHDPSLFGAAAGSEAIYGGKLERVSTSLAIPKEESVYLFYDASPLGTGKEGFALTDSGIYCRFGGEAKQMSWEAFAACELTFQRPKLFGLAGPGAVGVGEIVIPTSGSSARRMDRFFRALQASVLRAETVEEE